MVSREDFRIKRLDSRIAFITILFTLTSSAFAQYSENEGANGNSDRTTANSFSGLTTGATITGNSQGTVVGTTNNTAASVDYFNLTPQAASLGIYRHSVTLSTTGHTGTIRGQSVTGGTTTLADTFLQNDLNDVSVWYGFGKAETMNYRVAGTAATTANYTINYNAPVQITPTSLGSFIPGNITFSTVGFSLSGTNTQIDTTIFILDGDFNVLGRNDNEASPGTTAGSILSRNFTPGTYYFAVADTGAYTNVSPNATDRQQNSKTATGAIFVNDNTLTNRNLDFQVSSGGQNQIIDNTKVNAYDINFYSFTVAAVPEPGTLPLLLGALLPGSAFVRRRFAHHQKR
jgi:hypothetical protein